MAKVYPNDIQFMSVNQRLKVSENFSHQDEFIIEHMRKEAYRKEAERLKNQKNMQIIQQIKMQKLLE